MGTDRKHGINPLRQTSIAFRSARRSAAGGSKSSSSAVQISAALDRTSEILSDDTKPTRALSQSRSARRSTSTGVSSSATSASPIAQSSHASSATSGSSGKSAWTVGGKSYP